MSVSHMNQMRSTEKWETQKKIAANETIKEYKSRLVIDLKHCLTTKFYYLPFPARILIPFFRISLLRFFFVICSLACNCKKDDIWDEFVVVVHFSPSHTQKTRKNCEKIVHQLTFKVLRVINHTKCSSRRYTLRCVLLACILQRRRFAHISFQGKQGKAKQLKKIAT